MEVLTFRKLVIFYFPIILSALFQMTCVVNGENVYTELENLTPSQRQVLAEFKKTALPLVSQDYMKEDVYLVKFLTFNNFKLQKAVDHLKDMLKWREENNVDELVKNPSEEMTALLKDYPIYVDGYDKEERPICEVPYGAWKVRAAAAAGLSKKIVLHFFVNCFEKALAKVREQQALGKNVTQFVYVGNLDGFNVVEHICTIGCIPLILNMVQANDRYYPNFVHGFWAMNTPDSFSILFRVMRPVMSASTRAALKVFTSNEAEWKPFLREHVDFKEISDWYDPTGKERKSL